MRAAVSGVLSTHRPCMKKDARTCSRARVSRICSTTPGCVRRSGCSASKVSAARRAMPASLLLYAGDDDAAREHALEDQEQSHRNDERHDRSCLDVAWVGEVDAVELVQA